MKRITQINVASVFKMSLVVGAAAGVVTGCAYLVMSLLEHNIREGILTMVVAPVLYGLLGALINSFLAWVYNRAAHAFGGIEISLDD